SSVP
ncbi:hypothetical protein D046_4690B, partial [Vibrio parahaemolyticus V-223/04]